MNTNAIIVVADAARARLLRVTETAEPRARIALEELESLVHPEARVKEGDRHSGSFPAGVRSGMGGSAHTLNDHRGEHEIEERRRFCKLVSHAVAREVRERAGNPVLLVATHAVHAFLVKDFEQELPKEILLRSELGELTQLTPVQLLAELQRRGLLGP